MNQFEGECGCAQANESIMEKNMKGNLLGGFSREIGSMENNNNCKFKLKENRKFLNQNSLKRIRSLKKNKISEFILHKNSQEYMPPKAPENRTQYLSSLKKQIADFSALEKQKRIIQQKLLNLNNFNNNDEQKIARRNSFETFSKNTNNALNFSAHANKENLPFLNDEFNLTRRNSNYLALASDCCGNYFAAADFEKSDFINYHPEDEFLTGSTMKSIVESITKSKNKILSNSLNLDGNQSNLYFSNKEKKQIFPSSQIDFPMSPNKTKENKHQIASTAENLVEMNFKISDFIPDLQIDLDTNLSFVNNSNENFTEQQTDFFQWQFLNKLDSDFAENSTKEASSDNTPLEARSPLSLGNLRENELSRFFQNSVEENQKNEKIQFFLLGNKKQRSFSEHEYAYQNKENSNKKFFYDDKKS